MNYYEAAKIRKKGFAELMTDKLTSGQGVFSSVRSTLSDRSKARSMAFKEKFDPLNIAKTLTGGSNLAPAMLGRLLGRSTSDIKYFTGKREYTPRSESSYFNNYTPPSMSSGGSRKATRVLEKMLSFMEKSRADDMQEQDTLDSFNELNENMREDRHKEVMDVFIEATKAKRKAEKDMAREAKKREREAKKKEAESKKEPTPKTEPKKEAPPAKTEAPSQKAEVPKQQPKTEAPPTAKPVETVPSAPTAAPAPPTVTPQPPIVKPAIEAAKTAAKVAITATGVFASSEGFARTMMPYAKMASQKLGGKIPPEAILAQWAGESSNGKSLSAPFNYAGIKAGSNDKKGDYVLTEERYTPEQIKRAQQKGETLERVLGPNDTITKKGKQVTVDQWFGKGSLEKAQSEGKQWVQVRSYFSKYDNPEEFVNGYVKVLSQNRYKVARESTDASAFGLEVAKAGYATASAQKYSEHIGSYINQNSELLNEISKENANMKKDMAQGSAGSTSVIVQNNNTTQAKTNIHRAAPQEQLNPTMR